MTSYTFITNLSTTSPLLRWLFGFALCFEVFLPFDLLDQYFLFLTTMPFFHGATEFLYKKLWFIIPKRLVLYIFFLSKSWLICLLQLPILRVQFIPPSLVFLIDFLYFLKQILLEYFELPWGLSHKESICNAGHKGSISESGWSPEKGNGNPLWYSCLGNPRDKGAWWATLYEVPKESETT